MLINPSIEQTYFGGLSMQECRGLISRQNMLADKFPHGSRERDVFNDTQAVLEDLLKYVEKLHAL